MAFFLTRICALKLLIFSLAARAGWPDKDHVEIESPKKVWVGGLLFEGDEWSEQFDIEIKLSKKKYKQDLVLLGNADEGE